MEQQNNLLNNKSIIIFILDDVIFCKSYFYLYYDARQNNITKGMAYERVIQRIHKLVFLASHFNKEY